MREYTDFRRIPEEEVLLGEFDDDQIMEIMNLERNRAFHEVENTGHRTLNTGWVITEKVKE